MGRIVGPGESRASQILPTPQVGDLREEVSDDGLEAEPPERGTKCRTVPEAGPLLSAAGARAGCRPGVSSPTGGAARRY